MMIASERRNDCEDDDGALGGAVVAVVTGTGSVPRGRLRAGDVGP
jgi:hypothetical protein